MKGHLRAAILLFLVNFQLFAQSDATIAGQILEQNEPVPFASVTLSLADDHFVNGVITDENGHFEIKGLAPGTYTLSVSFVGYDPYQSKILIGKLNQNYDLGKIEIKPSITNLDEVTVAGIREVISSGLDKKTFNMDQNIAQSGGSVMDAMKSMPSISFDQDGKIILRGSDKVIVLIDGKQSGLTGFGNQKGLDNIPAANIERIEIINNPSAKYDANGMAGIVNIVYKKNKETGLHGSVGFTYGLGALTRRTDDLPSELGSFSPTPKYIPSLDLNYKHSKYSFYLQSEVLFQKRLPNNEFTTRYYDDGRIIASQVPENRKQTHYIVKGGIDYQISQNDIISFSGIYDWESHIDSAQVPYIDVDDDIRSRFISWHEEEITGYMNYLLHYEHKFKQTGHSLNTHLQYSQGWEDESYFINDSSEIRPDGRDITHVLGTEHTTSLSGDYTKPLFSGRVETGMKIQIRRLPVEYKQEQGENTILYPGLGNWSKWGESIYAGYFNWVHEKQKYDIEAGLRTEYTRVFYHMDPSNTYYQQDDTYDYFRLFPNIRLGYKLSEDHKISIFYNQRIDRPGEPELRIYPKSDDHELVKVGNPYLRPQYTQSAEVAYNVGWINGTLFISGYYRYIKDPYMRVYTQDTSNIEYDIILKSYANTGAATNKGVELVFSQQLMDSWKLSGNFNFYQNKIQAFTGSLLFPYQHPFDIEATSSNTWDLKVINTLDLSNLFQIQLTGLYIAPINIPQGRQLSRSSIDLGLVRKIWQGNGELTFSFTDIFNNYGLRQEITGDGFTAIYKNYYETQVLRIGLKRKF